MNKFFISDLHLGHRNIINFKDEANGNPDHHIRVKADGTPFESVEEMTEYQVAKWNAVVQPEDRVYILGDIAFPREGWDIFYRLNGEKYGILGNHDRHQEMYSEHLAKVHGALDMSGAVLTHVPVHPAQLEFRWKVNIHGHLHQNLVKNKWGKPDYRYINVSVEQCDFTPISEDEIMSMLKARGIQGVKLKERN
jgi:calcineurin-like phosphoesterase family protein